MFLHWNGYEIDGSDTDYDIVLPEKEQAVEFVNCFLNMPLFSQEEPKALFCYYKKCEFIETTKEQWLKELVGGKKKSLLLSVNCKNPNDLSPLLKETIYSFSAKREPLEKAYGKVDNPCTRPVRQIELIRGSLTVDLSIEVNSKFEPYEVDEENQLEGYVYQGHLMLDQNDYALMFRLNCGPSFYYEYAMYIMDYLKGNFPSIGICGGLDCEGGWTDGCTYADSLYIFEKIELPVKYSVKNTMRRLMEYNIAIPYKVYYKKGWQYDRLEKLILANNPKGNVITKGTLEEMNLTFDEYIELADIMTQTKDKNMIYELALDMLLPTPEEFAEDITAVEMLNQELALLNDKTALWQYKYYLTFSYNEENLMCEIRCHWFMKPYVLMLLKLMDARMIEFMKKTTYERSRKK